MLAHAFFYATTPKFTIHIECGHSTEIISWVGWCFFLSVFFELLSSNHDYTNIMWNQNVFAGTSMMTEWPLSPVPLVSTAKSRHHFISNKLLIVISSDECTKQTNSDHMRKGEKNHPWNFKMKFWFKIIPANLFANRHRQKKILTPNKILETNPNFPSEIMIMLRHSIFATDLTLWRLTSWLHECCVLQLQLYYDCSFHNHWKLCHKCVWPHMNMYGDLSVW